MRLTFLAEYPDGIRTAAGTPTLCDDVPAAYRECAKRLEARPRAFRVEAWCEGRYVTKAQRGVEADARCDAMRRAAAVLAVPTCSGTTAAIDHGPLCFGTCCLPTPREPDDAGGGA